MPYSSPAFSSPLPAASLKRLDLLRAALGWSDPRVRRIVGLMVPVLIGSSIAQVSLLLNTNLSTHLGDGRVSWLYYANRLMEFPLGIFSIAMGTAILPASRRITRRSRRSASRRRSMQACGRCSSSACRPPPA